MFFTHRRYKILNYYNSMAIFFLHILSTRKFQIDVKPPARARVILFFSYPLALYYFFTDHEWGPAYRELSEYFFRIELFQIYSQTSI